VKDCASKLGASLALALSLAPAAHAGPVEARSEVARDAAGHEGNAARDEGGAESHAGGAESHEPNATEAQASFTRAIDLYTQGDYRAAAQAFLDTYTISGEAAVLFNVAQCYRQLGDCDATRNAYRAYRTAALKSAEAEAAAGSLNPESAVPEAWPAEFIATCGEESEIPAASPKPAAVPAAQPRTLLSAKPTNPRAPEAKPLADGPKPLSPVAIAGWITTGLGVAAGGIALYYGLRVEAQERASEALTNDAADRNTTDWKTLGGNSIDDDGVRSARFANVFTGAAAVLGATGIYLLLSDLWSAPPKASPLNLGVSERGVFATWRQPL
jgi:tetratricopeptide (TPR) repeat protein